MARPKALCLVCGEPVVYHEKAVEVECALCGARKKSNAACAEGHFVCDTCHRKEGVDFIIEHCRTTSSTNPIDIIIEAMKDKAIYANGPEHHTLFGAALLAAYANAGGLAPSGGPLNLDEALSEMRHRSMQLPGGSCGLWGVCSAASSVGQAFSIMNGSTPMKREPWAQCHALTADVLGKLAKLGGPRCCKRNGYTAVLTAVEHIERDLGVHLDAPDRVVCPFFPNNAECLRAKCPYFPSSKKSMTPKEEPEVKRGVGVD